MDNIKVLLVDDEADFAATMQKRLTRRGLTVQAAHSGEECLAALREFDADVIILDVKMPGMDGLHTLREIKRDHPLVEVIMLSGHASMDTAVEGMEHGAFHYLMKPAELDEIIYKVEDAYKRKSLQEQKIQSLEKRAGPVS